MALSSLLCGPLIAFAPVIVKDIFHEDASHFGGLLSAFGVGGLFGAFFVLAIDRRFSRRRLSCLCALVHGVTVIGAALMHILPGPEPGACCGRCGTYDDQYVGQFHSPRIGAG